MLGLLLPETIEITIRRNRSRGLRPESHSGLQVSVGRTCPAVSGLL